MKYMNKANDKTFQFLNRLENIITDLSQLEQLSSSVFDQFKNSRFDGHEQSINKLDDLLLAATHETATQLAFIKQDITTTIHFIEFCEKYKLLSQEDLREIVDGNNLDVKIKLKLKQKLNSMDYLVVFKSIKMDWFNFFGNKSFDKIKK